MKNMERLMYLLLALGVVFAYVTSLPPPDNAGPPLEWAQYMEECNESHVIVVLLLHPDPGDMTVLAPEPALIAKGNAYMASAVNLALTATYSGLYPATYSRVNSNRSDKLLNNRKSEGLYRLDIGEALPI
jgi:hypothetical protein